MPLVRIDVIENRRTPEQLQKLADIAHQAVLDHFNAPAGDRYQIITEHKPGHIIFEDTGLGFTRSDDIVVFHIFQQGRSVEQKQALYKALADELGTQLGLDPRDLFISISENTKADWSFGFGEAQFVIGKL